MGLLISTQYKTSGCCFSNLIYFSDVYTKTKYALQGIWIFMWNSGVYTGRGEQMLKPQGLSSAVVWVEPGILYTSSSFLRLVAPLRKGVGGL